MADTTFVTLRAELGKLRADLKSAKSLVDKSIDAKPVKLTIDQSNATSEANKTLRSVQAAFRTKPIKLSVDRDQINRLFARPMRIRANVVVDRSSLSGLTNAQRVRLRIDHTAWRAEVARARSELGSLTLRPQTVRVTAAGDFRALRAELRRLQQEIAGVGNVNVQGGMAGGGGGGNAAGGGGGGFFGGVGGRFAVGAGVAGMFGGGRATMIGAGIGGVAGGIGGAVAGAGIGAATDMAAGFVGGGVSQNAELATIKIQLDRLLESSDKADELIQSLKEIDLKLPVDFTTISRAAQQLAAAGFDAAQIPKDLMPILDAAAMSNVGTEEGTNRIIRAITQIKSKGKLQAEEVMQLQELGLPAREIISSQFGGRNFDEVAKASQSGEIPIDEVLNKLIAGFGDRFGGVLEAQSETLGGQMDMLADKFRALQRAAAEPIMEPLNKALQEMIDAIDTGKFDDLAEAMGKMALASVEAAGWIAKAAAELVSGKPIQEGDALAGPIPGSYTNFMNELILTNAGGVETIGEKEGGIGAKLNRLGLNDSDVGNAIPANKPTLYSDEARANGTGPDRYDPALIVDELTRKYIQSLERKAIADEKPASQKELDDYNNYVIRGSYPVDAPVSAEEQSANEEAARKAKHAKEAADTAALDAEFGSRPQGPSAPTIWSSHEAQASGTAPDRYDPALIVDELTRKYIQSTLEKVVTGRGTISQQESDDYNNYVIRGKIPGGQPDKPIDDFALDGRAGRAATPEKTEQDRQQDYFDSLGNPKSATPAGYEAFKKKQVESEEKAKAEAELVTLDPQTPAKDDPTVPDIVTPVIDKLVDESVAENTGVDRSKYDLDSADEKTRQSETRRYEDDVKYARGEAMFNANRAEGDKDFKRLQMEMPKALKETIGQATKGDPILAKMLKGTTAKIEQSVNADGTTQNRVSLNRPDLDRGPNIQTSGVADINRLVQANVENAEQRRLQEKSNEKLEEINKGIQSVAINTRDTKRNTKGQFATVAAG